MMYVNEMFNDEDHGQSQQNEEAEQEQQPVPQLPEALVKAFELKEDLEKGSANNDIRYTLGQKLPNSYDDDDDDDDDDIEDDNSNTFTDNIVNGFTKTNQSSKDKNNARKNKKKKKKKKKNRQKQNENTVKTESEAHTENGKHDSNVEIEYIPEVINISQLLPIYRPFGKILDQFLPSDSNNSQKYRNDELDVSKEIKEAQELGAKTKERYEFKKVPKLPDEFDEDDNKTDKGEPKISKRKAKKLNRLSVAELKQLVVRPDVVEMHDVTARDPKLLVHLKAYRNTVPVPRHWCFKRKYLQGKRGIEKPPFDLPEFIKKTGIMEMRSALTEKDDAKTLKSKMRERARPKMGKIDIDYQKLHDAFFKWQTKPRLSIHGDLYYEGKEYETRLREKKPGDLSDDLRTALGMPVGPTANKIPPPWLIAMQRYGPPPSYPNLKIPGLNVPIPEGCAFGYHAGGWGKPPVDDTGKPLYGDVFGIQTSAFKLPEMEIEVDKSLWGELESESEEESEVEEEEDEEDEEQGDEEQSGTMTPAEGMQTPSGTFSTTPGLQTPEAMELRKKKIEADMDSEAPALYQVLPEKKVDRMSGMMASTHVYEVNPIAPPITASTSAPSMRRDASGSIEVALDPSELDLDIATMAERYESEKRAQSIMPREDNSDMVADHIRSKEAKRKKPPTDSSGGSKAKKYKDFKF